MGPLGHTKFHANQFTGVGTRPQNIKKIPLSRKESPPRSELLDLFLKFLSDFIR